MGIRAIQYGAGGVLLLLLAWHLLGPWETDEEQIRRRLGEAAAAFNEGAAGRAVAGFHPDWRDGGSGLDRQTLRQAVLYLAYNRGKGGPGWRVTPDLEGLELDLGPEAEEPRRARARFELTLERRRQGRWTLRWRAEVTADLVEDADRGWCFRDSSWETVEGRPPGR